MKNAAMSVEGSAAAPRLDPAWREALTLFDRDLRRRGAAERTRRAYGADLGQLAAWAGARRVAPQDVDYRALRRYAAHLSERRVAATTVARKLAATRQFFGSLVEHGRMAAHPPDPMPLPQPPPPRPPCPPGEGAPPRSRAPCRPARSPSCWTRSRPRRRSSCATAPCSRSP